MKICSICKVSKETSEFHCNKKGLFAWCKQCRREKDKVYHQSRDLPTKYKRVRERMLINKQLLLDYLLIHPCEHCGEKDPVVLEFHHLRDKINNVSNMMSYNSWKTIYKEVLKCSVLCANCHRKIHAGKIILS